MYETKITFFYCYKVLCKLLIIMTIIIILINIIIIIIIIILNKIKSFIDNKAKYKILFTINFT